MQIFVEGGSQGPAKNGCRQAFRILFEKVIPKGSFRVIASGSRSDAYKDFCLALKQNPDDYNILLVDSEEAVMLDPWEHLAKRQGDEWKRPLGSADEQAQLMVQVMEAWFLADREALSKYYGQGFLASSLPGQNNVELITKQDVFTALKHASRNTKTKGAYHKTQHGFDLLERVAPARIRKASGHAERLFTLLQKVAAS